MPLQACPLIAVTFFQLKPMTALVAGLAVLACVVGVASLPSRSSDSASTTTPRSAVTELSQTLVTSARAATKANLLFDECLRDLVDTSGIVGNSHNIGSALDAGDELGLSIAVGQTSYARAYLAREVVLLIQHEVASSGGSAAEVVTALRIISDDLTEAGDSAFSSNGSVALAKQIATLIATLRG